jgi:hypothetical protein
MKITKMGTDYVRINEVTMGNELITSIPRIHIIKLDFKEPTKEKVDYVLSTFKSTNRFVIDDNIRFYNNMLRDTNKKYYIANTVEDRLITFFKRNNKVLLDTTILNPLEKAFVFSVALEDVLFNTEVMIVNSKNYKENPEPFNNWSGNLILV